MGDEGCFKSVLLPQVLDDSSLALPAEHSILSPARFHSVDRSVRHAAIPTCCQSDMLPFRNLLVPPFRQSINLWRQLQFNMFNQKEAISVSCNLFD